MAKFNLKKIEEGNRFKLDKSLGLDNIRVELTWQGGDLDAEAWLLDNDGLIVNNEAFVFYNSENRTEPFDKAKFGNKRAWLLETRPKSADGAVLGPKDEIVGGLETINITLSQIAREVAEVVISATGHNCDFGSVTNAKITVIDEDSGDPLCFFDLSRDYETEDAVIAGRFIVNDDGDWEFEACGNGYNGGLQTLVDMYTD